MKTRKEALEYGLSFPNTYQDAPFHDPNWQLVRVKKSKKAFLWTYERDGFINSFTGKGSFVAPRNIELLREETLKQIEAGLLSVIDLAKTGGISSSDLADIFNYLLEDNYE